MKVACTALAPTSAPVMSDIARLTMGAALAVALVGSSSLARAGGPPAKAGSPEAAASHHSAAGGEHKDKPAAVSSAKTVGTAGAPATARQDPLDTLRDRLATRLGAKPVSVPDAAAARAVLVSSNAPGEFQVPAHALTRTAPAHRPAGKAAVTGDGAHGAETSGADAHGHGSWGYAGAAGPDRWAQLKPEFSLCGRGQRQSPIDIRDGYAVELEPVVFDYRPSRFQVVNSGHSLQADLSPGNRITVSGRSFELVQFHFHNPAEERINGRSFALSGHLVHKDADGRLAVVTVLFDRGAAHPVVQTVWNHLPLEVGVPESGRLEINPADLLPTDRRYFTYMGSLTTPPCTEGVQWIVLKEPVTLSNAQHDFFARLYPMNARPLQSAAGRIIKQSQ